MNFTVEENNKKLNNPRCLNLLDYILKFLARTIMESLRYVRVASLKMVFLTYVVFTGCYGGWYSFHLKLPGIKP